jgi:hypothetical protein
MFFWQNTMEPFMSHPATRCIILLLNLQNKLDIKERGQRRCHRFMFAHKLVPHLLSQHALAQMAKTLSFHNKPERYSRLFHFSLMFAKPTLERSSTQVGRACQGQTLAYCGKMHHHESESWGNSETEQFEIHPRFIPFDWQPICSIDLRC